MIVDLITDAFQNMNNQEAVLFLNGCAKKKQKTDKNAAYEIRYWTKHEALERNACPDCGNELDAYVEHEISEAWGTKVSEDFIYRRCNVCGWDEKKDDEY